MQSNCGGMADSPKLILPIPVTNTLISDIPEIDIEAGVPLNSTFSEEPSPVYNLQNTSFSCGSQYSDIIDYRTNAGLGFGVWGLGFGVWEIGRAHV